MLTSKDLVAACGLYEAAQAFYYNSVVSISGVSGGGIGISCVRHFALVCVGFWFLPGGTFLFSVNGFV